MNIQNLTIEDIEAKLGLDECVDTLGLIQAQIADLTSKADVLKTNIKEMGVGAYEGKLFRATVSTSERETLDMKAVREHLSRQFIAAHTNVTTVVTLKLAARTGKGV